MRDARFNRQQILEDAAKKLGDQRRFNAPQHAQRKFGATFERAAVLSSFSIDELGTGADEDEINDLLDLSRPVFDGDAQRWVLRSSTRKGVLKQLDSVDRIQKTLNEAGATRNDPLLQTIGDIVDGTLTNETDDLTQLSRLWSVRQLFSKDVDGLPAPESISRRIEFLNFIKPFQDLVGENFKGREDELARLADYVGVLNASSIGKSIIRQFRKVFSWREKPPLMLFGPGGIGKSSLIARFILDHAEALQLGQLPFTYIDFDRKRFTPQEPFAIFYEALHQLEIQFPKSARSFAGLRGSWAAEVKQTAGPGWRSKSEVEDNQRSVAQELLTRMIREFAETLKRVELHERPYLLFLDTFEKVRFQDRASSGRFWSYVEMLQDAHPYLRLIVSGRAPVGHDPDDASDTSSEFDLKTEKMPLGGLPTDLVAEYLADGGFPPALAQRAANTMNADDNGVSPLSMKVAVAVWHQRIEKGGSKDLDEEFWSELQAGRIQDQLITRYLDHLEDPDVQRIAGPALLLRVIDSDIVKQVIAPEFEVTLDSDEEAVELFEKLRDAIDMFASQHEDAVQIYPRAEVREILFELMRDLDRDKVNAIHNRAIDYYTDASDRADDVNKPALRAEEIYHRLARGSDESLTRARWNVPGVGNRLAGAETELPIQGKALLLSLMGDRVPDKMQRAASLATWEMDAIKRAQDAETVDEKLEILRERSERSPGSLLYADEAELLLEIGDVAQAQTVATRGLESLPATAKSAYWIDLQMVAAKIDWANGSYGEALERLSDAQGISVYREDMRKSLEVALLRYEWAASLEDETRVAEFRQELTEAVLVMPPEQLVSNVDLVERAVLDTGDPGVVLAGIRAGILEAVSGSGRRRLGRAMSAYDQRISKDQDEKPGFVADYASIPRRKSLNDTWQGLFIDLITLAPVVLDSVFSNFGVAGADKFLDTVVAELRRDPGKSGTKKPAELGRVKSSWWNRTLGSGRRLADTSRVFVNRFSIDELRMLVSRLGRSLESIVSLSEPKERLVYNLLKTADRHEWLEDLIITALEFRPADAGLLALANELEIGFLTFRRKELLQALQVSGDVDTAELFARLAVIGRQVCQVHVGGVARGTGMLVGPDLVLTTFAVLQDLGRTASLDGISFVFDVASKSDELLADGRRFSAQGGELVDYSEYNEQGAVDEQSLGYALIHVDGHPGDEPVFDPVPSSLESYGSIDLTRRGFIDLTGSLALPRAGEPLFILHHPLGEQLQVAISNSGIKDVIESDPSVRYRTNTLPGSAGAPCFNRNMQIIVLHQGSDGSGSFGTSIHAIVESMRNHNALEEVGVALL